MYNKSMPISQILPTTLGKKKTTKKHHIEDKIFNEGKTDFP